MRDGCRIAETSLEGCGVISREAVVQLYRVLYDHFQDDKKILSIVRDLKTKVKGNRSYRDTIGALEKEVRWRMGKD